MLCVFCVFAWVCVLCAGLLIVRWCAVELNVRVFVCGKVAGEKWVGDGHLNGVGSISTSLCRYVHA